jgi:hypothetical protein
MNGGSCVTLIAVQRTSTAFNFLRGLRIYSIIYSCSVIAARLMTVHHPIRIERIVGFVNGATSKHIMRRTLVIWSIFIGTNSFPKIELLLPL